MEQFPEFVANHLFLFSLLIGILMLLFWNLFGNTVSGIRIISPMEVTRMMNHENAVVLDIRNEKDFSEGHILNAVNIPAEKLQEKITDLEKLKDRPIVIACRYGSDSSRAARILKGFAIDNVHCIKGGLQAWSQANLPLTRD